MYREGLSYKDVHEIIAMSWVILRSPRPKPILKHQRTQADRETLWSGWRDRERRQIATRRKCQTESRRLCGFSANDGTFSRWRMPKLSSKQPKEISEERGEKQQTCSEEIWTRWRSSSCIS